MTQSPPFSDGYAHAGRLVGQCLKAFLPPQRISTANYAAQARYLSNEGGGYSGRWNHDKAPYLVGVMDALDRVSEDGDTPEHTTVALVKPAQCGGTETAANWMLRTVATDPADMLWYMQVNDALEAYVKKSINPMIEQHPVLHDRLGTGRTDNSLSFKRFLGMSVEFLPATLNNVKSKRAGRIVADEWDSYDLQGADPKTLLDLRRQTYGRESMLFALSHCDKAGGEREEDWTKGVMALYRESDRRIWWWQCPHCRMWSSPNPGADKQTLLMYSTDGELDQVAASAYLACPHNGCVIADHERAGMNLTGRWVGLGQQIDDETGIVSGKLVKRPIAGFWIVGIMSPFILGGIGHLARERVKAEREFAKEGSDASLREVICKQWGFPYQAQKSVGALDAAVLAARADKTLQLGVVPDWVRFLTAAVDTQGNRFEYLVRGWGRDRESVVIHHEAIPADPAGSVSDWDALLERVTEAEFPLQGDPGRTMRLRGVGIDSYGQPGVTPQAMAAWRRFKLKRKIKLVGAISGREAYTVMPLKGGTSVYGNPFVVTRPDADAKQRRTGGRGDVPVGTFNPNFFKDQLQAQLMQATPGSGYVHFPAGLLAKEPPHPFFEQMVAEQRLPSGRWEKRKASIRNETWDLMVMAGAIAHLFAPSKFDWDRPPSWAQPWDSNSLVGVASSKTTPAAAAPRASAPAPIPPGRPPAQPTRSGMTVADIMKAARDNRAAAGAR